MSAARIAPGMEPYLDRWAAVKPGDKFPDIVLSCVSLMRLVYDEFTVADGEAKKRGARVIPTIAVPPYRVIINLAPSRLVLDNVSFEPMAIVFLKDGKPYAATSWLGDTPLALLAGTRDEHDRINALPAGERDAYGRKIEDDLIAAVDAEVARRKEAARQRADA